MKLREQTAVLAVTASLLSLVCLSCGGYKHRCPASLRREVPNATRTEQVHITFTLH